MTTDKKLLERIQKLMALADPTKNDSQAQVEAAMEKVAELLTKHNLTPENITIHELKSQLMHQSSHVRWQDVDGTLLEGQFNEWLVDLARSIGYANYCKVLYMPHGATFIGKERDVEIANFMLDNLAHRLIVLSRQETKAYEKQYYDNHGDTAYKSYGKHHPKVWRRTWLQGAVDGLRDKLCKPRRDKELSDLERNRKETMAIVEVNDSAIQAYMDEMFPSLKSKRGFTAKSANGGWDTYAAGRTAGRNLSLQQGVKAGESKRTKELTDGK